MCWLPAAAVVMPVERRPLAMWFGFVPPREAFEEFLWFLKSAGYWPFGSGLV